MEQPRAFPTWECHSDRENSIETNRVRRSRHLKHCQLKTSPSLPHAGANISPIPSTNPTVNVVRLQSTFLVSEFDTTKNCEKQRNFVIFLFLFLMDFPFSILLGIFLHLGFLPLFLFWSIYLLCLFSQLSLLILYLHVSKYCHFSGSLQYSSILNNKIFNLLPFHSLSFALFSSLSKLGCSSVGLQPCYYIFLLIHLSVLSPPEYHSNG